MKKILAIILSAALCFSLTSCDKFFDDMEGDLSKVAAEDLLSTESGLLALLANLYAALPGNGFSTGDQSQMFANGARSTPDYQSTTAGFWNYGAVRSANKFLEALDEALANRVIDAKTKAYYEGEGRFLRACYYFASIRTHGGVPIVLKSLDEEYGKNDNKGLYYPRLTEKECWDWVIDEFQAAADLLPTKQSQEMRVNKYTALGMKARASLWAASESKYWTRASIDPSYNAVQKGYTKMEAEYAKAYYDSALVAAGKVINSKAYKLYGGDANSIQSAISNVTELFQNYKKEEGLLGHSYKTGNSETANGTQNWVPNQCAAGYTGTGVATYAVTLNLADEYDYYDNATDRNRGGRKIQTLVAGDENDYFTEPETQFTKTMVGTYKHYNSVQEPFLLKDARFQAWVIYPGATFRGLTINMEGGMVDKSGNVSVYPTKNDGVEFGDNTYYPYGGDGENNSAFFGLKTDWNSNLRSFYCFTPRKFMDQESNNLYPQTPWYDMRYAEILLIYAEAAVESGTTDAEILALGAKCLNDIRHRAGFKDDVPLTLSNVLHEWKCEFAFENKWTDVLYRRRAFYNANSPTEEEGTLGKKLTLIPMVDLSGAQPQWIFLRSLPYSATNKFNNYSGTFEVRAEDYYAAIPNYINNRIDPNNK